MQIAWSQGSGKVFSLNLYSTDDQEDRAYFVQVLDTATGTLETNERHDTWESATEAWKLVCNSLEDGTEDAPSPSGGGLC